MATTRRIFTDKYFWHPLTYAHRGWPWVERGTTQETDYPFRSANSLVLRFPFTRTSLVIGRWGPPRPEEEALLAAVRGSYRDLEDMDVRR